MSGFIAKTRKAFIAAGSAGVVAFLSKGGAMNRDTLAYVIGSAVVAFGLVYAVPNAK